MSSRPPVSLEKFLCLDLYAASRAVMKAYTPLLAPFGLTYPQYLVMAALWERDAQQVSALGERLSLDSGTLSPLLKRLESAGLVQRARSTEDERSVHVTLTAKGRGLQKNAPEVVTQMEKLFGLTPAQVHTLKTMLREVAERMEQGIPPS